MKNNYFTYVLSLILLSGFGTSCSNEQETMNKAVGFDQLTFKVNIGAKPDYFGESISKSDKTGWVKGDTIYAAIDGSNTNLCYLVCQTDGTWTINAHDSNSSFASASGKMNAIYASHISYSSTSEHLATTAGDVLYTDDGTYSKADNIVTVSLPINKRPVARIKMTGVSAEYWLNNGTEYVYLTSFSPMKWGTSQTKGVYNRVTDGAGNAVFYGLIPANSGSTEIVLKNANGDTYSRTYNKTMTAGESIAINGPTSSESSSWTYTSAKVAVTGISLSPSSLTLNVGSSSTITATVSPSNATNTNVTWSSSDATVATVSNGKVTAVKAGTTTITAKTEDGNFTATCAVTVTVPVTGVTLNKSTLALTVGSNATLTATVAPSNATNQNVTWTSSNASIATVSSTGKVTGIKAGTATVTVTTVDGSKTATCTVTVLENNNITYDGYDDDVQW